VGGERQRERQRGRQRKVETTALTYIPTSGKTSDVAGMFSATSIRNTVIDSSVVMPIVTFSPGHRGNSDVTFSPESLGM